ncbi:MAG: VCBS repeat-containing protein, partial [Actinomycetota bacterium]|nr:VCBS repeat-containing protein [Actinomycetota bacterium]
LSDGQGVGGPNVEDDDVTNWQSGRGHRFLSGLLATGTVLGLVGTMTAAPAKALSGVRRPATGHATAVSGITSGGSIVFVKDGNIWLSSPDGAIQHQVTTDGTPSAPYQETSQSDDGNVIVAAKYSADPNKPECCGVIYEMNRQGVLLRPPFAPPQFTPQDTGPCQSDFQYTLDPKGFYGAKVSPDGTKIAYSPGALEAAQNSNPPCSQQFAVYRVDIINLDGSQAAPTLTSPTDATDQRFRDPSWVDSSHLLVQHQSENAVYTYDLGAAALVKWFGPTSSDDIATYNPVLRGSKLITTGLVPLSGFGHPGLRLWSLNGVPPAAPTPRCDFYSDNPDTSPSWAPDGNAAVWASSDALNSPNDNKFGPGVYILPVGNLSSGACPSKTTLQLLVAGGKDPSWGPAPIGRAPAFPGVSVFRPSNGGWYFNSPPAAASYGASGDIAVPGDYGGDGKVDMAVYRPSVGTWYIHNSSTGTDTLLNYGVSSDIPVPAAYDGTGKTNIAVYRPSTGAWYIRNTNGTDTIVTFGGIGGDIPVPGDWEGTGKADLAIYRPSSGTWFIRQASGTVTATSYGGNTGDIPVPGDYDGDGKVDMAIYRPSVGTWYIRNSGTGTDRLLNYGVSTDQPVPGDYPHAGRADIAVFRPSTAAWYIHNTDGSDTIVTFGLSSDQPLPLPYAIRHVFF